MKINVDKYICTTCRKPFSASGDRGTDGCYSDINCQYCGISFSVKNGIPRFVPAETYADSFGYQWNIHRKTQLDSYTGISVSRDRLFKDSGWPENLEGQRILEAGSGAGRFTEVLLQTGAEVFSFDFSTAVEANYVNNGQMPGLNLFQGNIFDIPLPYESFDKVVCIGVLQHTPDPEMAFKNLVKYVKPGGEILVDVYRADLFALIQWKYLLRPLTKRIDKKLLYEFLQKVVPPLIPVTKNLGVVAGRVGRRLSPIVEYSQLGLPEEVNRDWAILDTFDMYSPAHDHPKSVKTIKRWFADAGFDSVVVEKGSNGVIGRGKKISSMLNGES